MSTKERKVMTWQCNVCTAQEDFFDKDESYVPQGWASLEMVFAEGTAHWDLCPKCRVVVVDTLLEGEGHPDEKKSTILPFPSPRKAGEDVDR